jgi:hypothetical protein
MGLPAGKSQTALPGAKGQPEPSAALTLHSCDEVFAVRRAQKFRADRVSHPGQIFGLRMCHPQRKIPRGRLASAFTGRRIPIGSAPAPAGWRSGLMRNRSATVAGLHGLPCCRKESKELGRRHPGPPATGIQAFFISSNTDVRICSLPYDSGRLAL